MYLKTFDVRWSDLDANWHLANGAYVNYMSSTRMAFLFENGFDRDVMTGYEIGPVIFYEHVYYLKEVLPGPPVRVSLEIKGTSRDGMFFEFHHNFYDHNGQHLAHCEMMGGWMDLKTRKLTPLAPELLDRFEKMDKAGDFRILNREDTRRYVIPRKDLV